MEPLVDRKAILEGACPVWEEAGTVMLGVPLDSTSSYRPGSRFAPEAIRNVFWEVLEDYSMGFERHFTETSLFDWGEVRLSRGNIERELDETHSAVQEIVRSGKKPLILGGEHTATVAAVDCVKEKFPEVEVIQLDAHADLRSAYLGEKFSHASAIYRLLELGVNRIHQLGVRSCTREEHILAREKTCFYTEKVTEALRGIVSRVKDRPVYLTLDIDVVDPAFAPGTGTPEPGGITSGELLEALALLKGVNLVGFDLVEVSPPYDCSSTTSILAARIVREMAFILDQGLC